MYLANYKSQSPPNKCKCTEIIVAFLKQNVPQVLQFALKNSLFNELN